jgi:hypothetical protein
VIYWLRDKPNRFKVRESERSDKTKDMSKFPLLYTLLHTQGGGNKNNKKKKTLET